MCFFYYNNTCARNISGKNRKGKKEKITHNSITHLTTFTFNCPPFVSRNDSHFLPLPEWVVQ